MMETPLQVTNYTVDELLPQYKLLHEDCSDPYPSYYHVWLDFYQTDDLEKNFYTVADEMCVSCDTPAILVIKYKVPIRQRRK